MISIIVPIYNVECYINRCLDSLVALNTIENVGIEIVLIDDGSTDKSGIIADEYAENHSSFRVYHTENHGLAAARNYGIEKSTGEWIMFVDSDDWVHPDFCNLPYSVAVENKADLVVFSYYNVVGFRKKSHRIKINGHIGREEAVDIGEPYAWNKLYRRILFDSIRYPEGHNYEDVATTHKLIYYEYNYNK